MHFRWLIVLQYNKDFIWVMELVVGDYSYKSNWLLDKTRTGLKRVYEEMIRVQGHFKNIFEFRKFCFSQTKFQESWDHNQRFPINHLETYVFTFHF